MRGSKGCLDVHGYLILREGRLLSRAWENIIDLELLRDGR